ncbi:BTB/POZ and MATH domain-containing protein 2-like [Aegilops tauschii subsp. strangulata]|uniref:Speckle-type POZ protein-like protein A n=1 Tax=Aegilops tauschii TaxID=37682 RepID=R7VZ67_AEGTA
MSMCNPLEEAQGTHVFNILGYSKHKGMGHDDNSYIRSGVFMVGDHNWAIRFFPDGYKGEGQDYISVYLELLCITELRASCDMRLFKRPHVTETKSYPKIDMPPPDMTDHVAKLLEEKEGFDVSFIVGGEMIEAHRFVLAMRSPVLKEELYGSMQEARPGQCIIVQDMQPAVFKAILHFIYTDSLPSSEDTEMVRLLLVAADRYAMDRLKLVCQSILCEDLNKDTVTTTLALAHQHNCHQLKDACLQFIELSGFKDFKANCPSFIEDTLEKRRKSS